MAGAIRERVDILIAPSRDTRSSNHGTVAARPTVKTTLTIFNIYYNAIQHLLTCEQVEKDPGEELGIGIHPVGQYGLQNVGTDDVHHNIELEGVGEEDGHTEH